VAERVEIQVTGRVQGVAFRWYTARQAESLGVVGTVRNLPDGSVRVVAEGERAALEALLHWVSRGPDHALVTDCRSTWSASQGGFTGFLIAG